VHFLSSVTLMVLVVMSLGGFDAVLLSLSFEGGGQPLNGLCVAGLLCSPQMLLPAV
jgi:predicted oxidoreductase